jgi:sRNA-binding protein
VSLQYQYALRAGGARYDLNGEPCGELTTEQQQGAQERLKVIHQALKILRKKKRLAQQAEKAASFHPSGPASPAPKVEAPKRSQEGGGREEGETVCQRVGAKDDRYAANSRYAIHPRFRG